MPRSRQQVVSTGLRAAPVTRSNKRSLQTEDQIPEEVVSMKRRRIVPIGPCAEVPRTKRKYTRTGKYQKDPAVVIDENLENMEKHDDLNTFDDDQEIEALNISPEFVTHTSLND